MLLREPFCYRQAIKLSIFGLSSLVRNLHEYERATFNRIYEVDNLYTQLELPESMRSWAKERLGGIRNVELQQVVRVTNLVTGEGALFNYLRSKRPQQAYSQQNLESIIKEHEVDCPFCYPEKNTPKDVFGRITGKYCVTASNVAKYDGYHSLVIPREHNPLKFNASMVEDYFQVAGKWFEDAGEYAVSKSSGAAFYPFLMWNCLWPAGSSIVHGHLQLTLTRGRHYPRVDWLRQCSQQYFVCNETSYFEDLFCLHKELGLAHVWNNHRIVPVITPIKEKEIWIMDSPGSVTPERLGQMGKAVCQVLDVLINKTGTNSFNVVAYLPPLANGHADWSNFPLIARLVDRGDVFSRTADFGAMELFATSVISTDPFDVARSLR